MLGINGERDIGDRLKLDCDSTNINEKRGFRLKDEDLLEKKNAQIGKKTRLDKDKINLCVHFVEKASENWP